MKTRSMNAVICYLLAIVWCVCVGLLSSVSPNDLFCLCKYM